MKPIYPNQLPRFIIDEYCNNNETVPGTIVYNSDIDVTKLRIDKTKIVSIDVGQSTEGVIYVKDDKSFSGDATSEIFNDPTNSAASKFSHAEGQHTEALGSSSHSEGQVTSATGDFSHSEGQASKSTGSAAHSEGCFTTASGPSSHAENAYTSANGWVSHTQGFATKTNHSSSSAGGYLTVTGRSSDTVIGVCNAPREDSLFTIGYGIYDTSLVPSSDKLQEGQDYTDYLRTGAKSKNLFRVTTDGDTYGLQSFISSGTNFAQYLQPWYDENINNEDRRGYFVTLKDGKLYKATSSDHIIGVTASNSCMIANGDEDWLNRWKRDDFGDLLYEEIEVPDYTNEYGYLKQKGSHIEKQTVEVDDYDTTKPYVARKYRPEWSCVATSGVVSVRDDGTCIANQLAKCTDEGIATIATTHDSHTFYILDRVSENVVTMLLGDSISGNLYGSATSDDDGLMSSEDKYKLDQLEFMTDNETSEMLDEIFGG